MKKILILPILAVLALLSACTTPEKYDVVTTLYIQYDMVRSIAENKLTYNLVMPIGSDAHSFDPTSKQIIQIESSKVFLFTSNEMDPWVTNLDHGNSNFVDLSVANVFDLHHDETEENHDDEHESHDHDEHDGHGHDENLHYWTVLENQIEMVDIILDALIEIKPDESTFFTTNATKLKDDLQDIKAQFLELPLTNIPLYYIGHNVFSLFNEETNLNIISLTDSFITEVNPTSQDISLMIKQIKDSKSNVFFYDAFEGLETANSIETDLLNASYQIIKKPLYSMHNISKDQFENKTSILDLWYENLANIKRAYGV